MTVNTHESEKQLQEEIARREHAERTLRRQTERLQNLRRTDKAILMAIASPETIVQEALLQLCRLLQCQRASVGIFDQAEKKVQVFAADSRLETIVQAGVILPEDAFGDIGLLRQGKMEIIEDLLREGIHASINVPLLSSQELYGALNVGWESPRSISQEESEIAEEVGGQITLAMEQNRLLLKARQYATELEHRVLERTRQLEAANKELEAFSFSVSHDLRAPLRAVDGYTRMLSEDYGSLLDDEGKRICSIISQSALDMGKLIDDLLAFSRVGRTELQSQELDMAGLAGAVFLELTTPAGRERIDLKIASLPSVRGDPALIRLVWTNLLLNAVKFSAKRERAVIAITAEEGEKEIVFSITDNGAGFDMAYVEKLFGVFQRLHSAREFDGTGVGLAIVQRIIQRHGGRIWAEGVKDQGATFHFSMPRGAKA